MTLQKADVLKVEECNHLGSTIQNSGEFESWRNSSSNSRTDWLEKQWHFVRNV